MAITISLKVVVVVHALLVCGALVGLIIAGTEVANSSINTVADSLRQSVADNARKSVEGFIQEPFDFLGKTARQLELGAISMESWEGSSLLGKDGMLRYLVANKVEHPAYLGSIYCGTEHGHFAGVQLLEPNGVPTWEITVAPPIDQIMEPLPSFSIPCRYQRNCDNSSGWCLDMNDPFRRVPMGSTPPYWAVGEGRYQNADYAAAYAASPTDPAWATYAVLQNPNSAEPTKCRPTATAPKPPCTNAKPCTEFNRSQYWTDQDVTTIDYWKTRADYDTRARSWYLSAAQLPHRSKFFADIYICARDMMPCLTATLPFYITVPSVGARVQWMTSSGVSYTGAVTGHRHTEKEMFTPIVQPVLGSPVAVSRHTLTVLSGPTEEKLTGVLASDFFTTTLKDLVDSIQVGKTGSWLIADMSPQAMLITSGFPCDALKRQQPGEVVTCFVRSTLTGVERVSAFDPYCGDVASGVMTKLYDPVRDPLTGGYVSTKIQGVTMKEDHTIDDNWVHVLPIREENVGVKGVDWLIVVVIPKSDYLDDIAERQVISLAVSVSASVVALGLLLLLAVVYVVAPVSNMINDFQLACSMQLEALAVDRSSRVNEISTLQKSFGVLVSNLRLYKPFLPPSVLGQDEIDAADSASSASQSTKITQSRSQHSRSCSRQSSVNVHGQQSRLALGKLRRKNVTIVALNLRGFSQNAEDTLLTLHTTFVDQVLRTMRETRGVAEPFSGDHMVMSYNGSVQCNDYKRQAQIGVLALVGDQQWSLNAGVSSSSALVGNMGTDVMRKFSFVGKCYGLAITLCQLNKAFDSKSLVSQESRLAMQFEYDFANVVVLGGHRIFLWTVVRQGADSGPQEWMYELAEQESSAEQEWIDFLTGVNRATFTVEEIMKLKAHGVDGKTYTGSIPPETLFDRLYDGNLKTAD
eukprot:TRINITY_DN11759_c0_g1_i1.p1 TRINITY_DN11759_c0_g1~~TRINITY_DN11759_c0_g1_i1.p1  ORF type:complete len:920 (+),score=249.07 TRINITY_DN11759_c0_g1_i1:108-2867(+)